MRLMSFARYPFRLLCGFCIAVISYHNALAGVAFESGQVRPLAMSADGTTLFAVNTPDSRLEIYTIGDDGLVHRDSVTVGSEPVALAVRDNTEVWVVNHLSDSVSIVDTAASPPRVIRTLQTGDEPRDIVFAGTGLNRAFITAAHRGQNSPYTDPNNPGEMITPGAGRADVWVFDADNLGTSLGGTPLTIVTMFGDTARALAVSPDNSTVYAAVFLSGNQTTAINEGLVCNGGASAPSCSTSDGQSLPGGLPAPNATINGNVQQNEVGLVVKFNGTNWIDELGRNWDAAVRFSLPDLDVFAIDANANPPVEIESYPHVGTVLYNMAVNPVTGMLYVANTEARNEVRFEGSRPTSGPGSAVSTVQGHLHETRISIIDPGTSSVLSRHLNKHIDYSISPAPSGVKDHSLAIPQGMVVSPDGDTLYLAAKGSDKVGIFDTGELAADTFTPNASSHIQLSGGGPSGLALDTARNRLYVLTRFDNGISVINTATATETQHYQMANPEPAHVINGRAFLYSATLTSSNGEASCASCHVDGDTDGLSWDLGDPMGSTINNPGPFIIGGPGFPGLHFHPMKGPMTTQTLRGLATHGSMHWRGDRTGGNDEPNVQPNSGTFNENLAFMKFNVAFTELLGRESELATEQMQAFTDFILEVLPPPNPVRNLDDQLTTRQAAAENIYFNRAIDGGLTCNGCHVLNPSQGFFGTDGRSTFELETQFFKVAQLRNLYTKVGMFGMAPTNFFNSGDNQNMGPQIRGTGFMHDGATDTLFRFFNASAFDFFNDTERRDMELFMFAFPSNLKPIVGQQVSLDSSSAASVNPRVDLLMARAVAGDNDVIAKGVIAGDSRGWKRLTNGDFQGDLAAESPLSEAQLRSLATQPGNVVTFTAVAVGSAQQAGIDRDLDGVLDGDDVCPAAADAGQADGDSDGVGDVCDNCIAHSNSDQRDTNGDGFGNRCDADLNGDNAVNFADLGIMKSLFFSTDTDADLNGDGAVNFADLGILKSLFFNAPGPSAIAP